MRLIDADKVIQEFEKNITTYESNEFEEGTNTGIRWCTGDVVNASTVKAVPIEWVKKYAERGSNYFLYAEEVEATIKTMLEEWEKENE